MLILIPVFILIFLISLRVGRFQIPFADFADLLQAKITGTEPLNAGAATVFWTSRLPRVCAGALIGCALSVSGASYQGIFRNPMVSPDLLGASAGAGFGAALGFLIGVNTGWYPAGLCYGAGGGGIYLPDQPDCRSSIDNSRILLVLCGIVTGSLLQAFISIVKVVADPYDTLPSITFWLMGGLNYVTLPRRDFC